MRVSGGHPLSPYPLPKALLIERKYSRMCHIEREALYS